MLILRATRTRRPARSISISVRLVSSSNSARSRISAWSPDVSAGFDFAAGVSSGWRAMGVIRSLLFGVSCRAGFRLCADLPGDDPGGQTVDRQPVSVDTEAAQRGERGAGGEGVVAETFAGVDI